MMKKSILKGIFDAVNLINWKTEFIKHKALLFCELLYNNYIHRGILFNNYVTLPHNYIKYFIPKRDHQIIIVKELINNNIIIVDNSYDKVKHISKGYKFNYNFYNNLDYILYVAPSETIINTSNSEAKNSQVLTNYMSEYIVKMLGNLSVNNDIGEKIDNYKIEKSNIILNNDIDDEQHYILMVNNKKYSDEEYNVKYGKKMAKSLGMDLILYKEKLYIDILENFITQKELHWKLTNKMKIFDIQNNIWRVNRNQTNFRLDTNITNFPSTLLNHIYFKNEPMIEIDIKNSQFAFLCYITKDLDKHFIKWCQNGIMYDKIAELLNIDRAAAKQYMFEIAFGKVKKEHDIIRNVIPKTMNYIDEYKKKNGYKAFSNLLQRKESEVMIDGLLEYLYIKGYEFLTVHDSVRVNKSMAKIIKKEIELYFKQINFKCNIGNK
jgi:hypothetical protein